MSFYIYTNAPLLLNSYYIYYRHNVYSAVDTIPIRMSDTNIPITSEMRDRLRAAKKGGETYSDTIERLLDAYNNE